jgi:hypothetical protein
MIQSEYPLRTILAEDVVERVIGVREVLVQIAGFERKTVSPKEMSVDVETMRIVTDFAQPDG